MGVTSNPTIFQAAIAEGDRTTTRSARSSRAARPSPRRSSSRSPSTTSAAPATSCSPSTTHGNGKDGYVSLEVDPNLAHETEATIEEAKRLHALVDRQNLFIKIPATKEGLPAIEETIAAGIPVNVTLIFSLERYRAVAEAYVRGLQRLAETGGDLSKLASVASFFVSRVDTEGDKRLDEIGGHDELKGKLAIANAKLAYKAYSEIFSGDEWEALDAKGATAQRCLWASTSTKNPEYRDVIYVEELIGEDTVNTMPPKTIEAFEDHGEVADTLAQDLDGAQKVLDDLAAAGRRLRRRGRHAREGGREEVRRLLQGAVLGHRVQARSAGGRVMATKGTDFQRELGQQLRVDSVRSSAAANSGHPTSSMSAADLMAVLLDGHLQLDYQNPANPANDHLVFSKGHASPLYYAILKAAGAIDDDELLTFRKLNSRLEGHPTPRIPPTDVATGSLGQGLPISVGIAMAGRSLDKLPYRVWCLCGDSEMAEGSMWEAFQHAGWEGLDNLVAIIDVNRLGQTRETMLGWNLDGYAERIRAFGWHAIEIDGHDVEQIEAAYTEAEQTKGKPTAIIARTKKGKGVKAVEDLPGKHGKPLDDPDAAIEELGGYRDLTVEVALPEAGEPGTFDTPGGDIPVLGARRVGRHAQGLRRGAGRARQRRRRTWSRSTARSPTRRTRRTSARRTRTATSRCSSPSSSSCRAAVGMQVQHRWKPFVSTFSAFFSRAYDFIRMAAISRADIRLVGSHAGVSIGEDGPSQMALEDIASLRAIHSSTVLHPSDANQAAKLIVAMADLKGISFLRTLRGKTPVRTPADEDVSIGGSRIVSGADAEDVAIVACGITVDEAVARGRDARGRGHQGPRHRLLLDQADRRRDPAGRLARVRGDRHRRGPLARGRPGRRGARGARGRRRPRPGDQARRARDAGLRLAGGAAARCGHRRRGDRRGGTQRGGRPSLSPTRRVELPA